MSAVELRRAPEPNHMASWVRPTAPTPRILPPIISSARAEASITSMMREVFSSSTARIKLMQYRSRTKNIMYTMTNAPAIFRNPFFAAFPASSTTLNFTGSSAFFISSSPSPFFFSATWRIELRILSLISSLDMALEASCEIRSILPAASASSEAQTTPSSCLRLTFSARTARSLSEVSVSTSTVNDPVAVGLPLEKRDCTFCRTSRWESRSGFAISSPVFWSEVTTARCFELLESTPLASRPGRIVRPSIMNGKIKVITIKALVRTRSRCSRRAISMTLRIGFPHDFDEDFLERRLHQLEPADPAMLGHSPQKLLRIGPGGHPHFHVVAKVVKRLHQFVLRQKVPVAFIGNLHVVFAKAGLHFLKIALKYGLAAVDQADGIAEFFHLVHAMSGEQDGLAPALHFQQHVLEDSGVDGIEAEERLIHHHKVGIVQQCGDKLYLLLHALGKRFHFLADLLGDFKPLAPVQGPFAGFAAGQAVYLSQKNKLVEHFHLLIQAASSGQVA